jgi:glycosyltransferase involved in cell wall biosynthesis
MKVSILLITYNHEKYIGKAIESILMQQHVPEHEIIVCDDSSADNTISLATMLLKDCSHAQIYKNENNLGITRNYQQAFTRCSGDYIFILEGDDYWTDPLKIKTISDFFDSHPDCAVCAHTFLSLQQETAVMTPPANNAGELFTAFTSEQLILDSGIISNFSSCSYRRSMLEKISPATYTTHSYEWMINISAGQFGTLAKINKAMSVYRMSSAGAWANKTRERQLQDIIGIIDKYNEILGYRYAKVFEKKKKILTGELANIRQRNSKPRAARMLGIVASLRWLLTSTTERDKIS